MPKRSKAEASAWTDPRLVVGTQSVREAVRAHGQRMGPVLFQRPGNAVLRGLQRLAEASGVQEIRSVDRAELEHLSQGVRHQGVAAWAPPLTRQALPELLQDPDLMAVALDGIQDPQNFGAVVRGAVALSGAAVIWPENASAPLTAATCRASAGAIEHARLCLVPSLRGALFEASAAGAQIVGLAADAPRDLREVDLTGPTILVLGSEGDGMSRSVRKCCGVLARLAELSSIDSLNAAVAAAVALYEVACQRRPRGEA